MSKNKNSSNGKAKKGGVTPRSAIYAKISGKRNIILEALFELLNSKNDNVKLGAAKVLLNKLIADLKAEEFNDPDENQVNIYIFTNH